MSIKIFAHRGLVENNITENSLEAFKNAYNQGFRAIEFDIWYLDNQLILSHDQPFDPKNLSRLEDLLQEFSNHSGVGYWLDFKNLNNSNCDMVIEKVKELTDSAKINLTQLYFAPFITDLKQTTVIYQTIRQHFSNNAQILAVIEKLEPQDYQEYYQQLKNNNIYGLSINYHNIQESFKKIFKDIRIFAWTVNDRNVAKYLEGLGIENIASDSLRLL